MSRCSLRHICSTSGIIERHAREHRPLRLNDGKCDAGSQNDFCVLRVQTQGASPRHTRQVTVRSSPTAAASAAAFPSLPGPDGTGPNSALLAREAELSRDDIVGGAHDGGSGRALAPFGEEVSLQNNSGIFSFMRQNLHPCRRINCSLLAAALVRCDDFGCCNMCKGRGADGKCLAGHQERAEWRPS